MGSALLTVLVILTVVSVIGGTALAVVVQQRRFMRHDAHRLQARYAAEAGVYAALARLEGDPSWRPERSALPLFEDATAIVSVRPFGGYYLVESEATVRRASSGVRAVVGAQASSWLRHAIVLGDGNAILSVSGLTEVRGDLLLGPRGLRESALRGVPFRGSIAGRVLDGGASPLPAFSPSLFEGALEELDGLLDRPPARAINLHDARRDGPRGPLSGGERAQTRRVYVATGPTVLRASDTLLWRTAADLFVRGDLTVAGGFHFPPGSRLAASGTLRMMGAVAGRGGVLYGRVAVEADGAVSCSAQLLSRERVAIGEGVALLYPSALYVSGVVTDGQRNGSLELRGDAVVDGTLVYPSPPVPVEERGHVLIGRDARVRGGVYTATALELLGTVEGSVLTRQFAYRDPPRTYLGWLVNAKVDVRARPSDYVPPVGLQGGSRLEVLAWEPMDSIVGRVPPVP